MPSDPRDRSTTVVSGGATPGVAPALGRYLLVVGEDRLITVPLPARGELVLGRDASCDVELPHERISRRHARILLDRELAIEDLGSTNGIKVVGTRLERGVPAPLPIGESVKLGPFTVIVLAGAAGMAVTDDGVPRAELVVRDPTPEGATELLERVARHGINVLIQGETGVGKEVLARTLHALSARPGELVAINCAALTGPLLESELFGHEQGAFTGATRTKQGLLEIAGRGTALLDEIGDLPLELQGKLLRALESRQVYRVGGVKPIELQLRVIAATHRRLADEVARGGFRQDLYFRLNGITLEISPLRARRGAITALAERFLDESARSTGSAVPRIAPAAMAALIAHDWPGNVRELKLVIERAHLLAGSGTIEVGHVLLSPARAATAAVADENAGEVGERARFLSLARAHHGNITEIGRALGTSRSQVRRLAQKYAIDIDALRKR
jgi:two-component system response regulator AtoC